MAMEEGGAGSYHNRRQGMEGVDLCIHNGTSRCVGDRWPCLKNIK